MNNKNTNNSRNSGLSSLSILELIFITLKLLGKINWSWWWVFAPTWIPILIILLAALISYIISK